MPLSDKERAKFNAFVAGFTTPGIGSSLLEMTRKSDGTRVLVVCHRFTANGRTDHIPFAELILGEPHELYNPPDTLRESKDVIPPPAPEL